MGWKKTVDVSTEPVTTAEAKTHLRIDHSDDDTYIAMLIKAARQYAENIQNRALAPQTWAWTMPTFESAMNEGEQSICLPVGPVLLTSDVAISYRDTADSSQTLATTVYRVVLNRTPEIYLIAGQSWPALYDRPDAVTITWTAGFATSATVPEFTRLAILFLVSEWYRRREGVVTGTIQSEVPHGVTRLLLQDASLRF